MVGQTAKRECDIISVNERNLFSASSFLHNFYQPSWPVSLYLLGFQITAAEVFYTVHEAILRHLIVRPEEILEL